MNNKVSQKKYRRLSIAAFILGILTFASAFIFFIIIGPIFGKYIENFIPENFPDYFIVIFFLSFSIVCFAIPAIICGSIDFKKIKKGQYSNNGLALDIFGILLGGVFILFALLFLAFL